MSFVAVAVGGGAIVGGLLSSSGAKSAAKTQADASAYAAQIQWDMWKEQQVNMEPFLKAGQFGIVQLQDLIAGTKSPQYIQAVQDVRNFQLTNAPSANFMIDPVTGRTIYTAPQTQQAPMQGAQAGTYPTGGGDYLQGIAKYQPSDAVTLYGNTKQGYVDPLARRPYGSDARGGLFPITTPEASGVTIETGPLPPETRQQVPALGEYGLSTGQPTTQPAGAQQYLSNLEAGGVLAPSLPTLPGTLAQPNMPGTLAIPTLPGTVNIPELPGAVSLPEMPGAIEPMEFEFNEEDPAFQYKLQQLEESTKRELSARGMLGSRAGQDILAENKQRLISEEVDKQYGRATEDYQRQVAERNYLATIGGEQFTRSQQERNYLAGMGQTQFGMSQQERDYLASQAGQQFERAQEERGYAAQTASEQYARAVGERDYLANAQMQLYGAGVQRGETLYNRLYQQQQDLYNRMYGQATTEDARRLGLLQGKYGMEQGLYEQQYGGLLNLAQIGAGQQATAAQLGTQTAANIGGQANMGAAAQAQAQLYQGQMMGNLVSGLGGLAANTWGGFQTPQVQSQQYGSLGSQTEYAINF